MPNRPFRKSQFQKNLCNLCICINEEIHRNSISNYHILLCAQQPQPFHHLSPLHNAEGRNGLRVLVEFTDWDGLVATLRMLRRFKWNARYFFQSFPIFLLVIIKSYNLCFFHKFPLYFTQQFVGCFGVWDVC